MTLPACEVSVGPFEANGVPVAGVLFRFQVMSRSRTEFSGWQPWISLQGLRSWSGGSPDYGPTIADDGTIVITDTQEVRSGEDGMLTFSAPRGWQCRIECPQAGLSGVATIPDKATALITELLPLRWYLRRFTS